MGKWEAAWVVVGDMGLGCAPMSCATLSGVSWMHRARDDASVGHDIPGDVGAGRGVSTRRGPGRKQTSATVINGACVRPLRASEEFITATLPCHQARIIWIMLLSWRAGRQGCPAGMRGAGWASHRPPGSLVTAGPAVG